MLAVFLSCLAFSPAYAHGFDFGKSWVAIIYFSGTLLLFLAVIVGAIALFIFGPIYLAVSSTKRRERMAALSPLKKKVHRFLHWATGLTIGALVLYILVAAVYTGMTQR